MQPHQSTVHEFPGPDLFSLIAAALAPVPYEPRPGTPDTAPTPMRDATDERGLFERLDQWLWKMHQRDIEAYLARSADIYDLEARQRALNRNVPVPYY
jgi:uncharacterized protein DUF3563